MVYNCGNVDCGIILLYFNKVILCEYDEKLFIVEIIGLFKNFLKIVKIVWVGWEKGMF